MKKGINLVFQDSDGCPTAADVAVYYRYLFGNTRSFLLKANDNGEIYVEPPLLTRIWGLTAALERSGFWEVGTGSVKDSRTYTFQRLPLRVAEDAWWLKCIGIETADPNRGKRIKIGVVDRDFRSGDGLKHIAVKSTATLMEQTESRSQAHGWGHGEAICRILADRSQEASFLTVACGAQIVFADASGQEPKGIDPARAAASILRLAVDEQVDIINLSWGEPILNAVIQDAVETANALGVTIVAAAGNDGETMPLYPARLAGCIGVGALGSCDWGPSGTLENWFCEASAKPARRGFIPGVGDIYAWFGSACGHGLDVIAPGIGILFQRDRTISYAVSGTSFASALVSGLLAVALARSEKYFSLSRSLERTEWVRQLFSDMCYKSGMKSKFEGGGVPRL